MQSHILIVDDEVDLTSLFRAYLQELGYRVTVANDGVAALATDQSDPADLVITDLTMPGMDGKELAARLHQRCPELPVIVVSGYAGNAQFGNRHISIFAKPVSMVLLGKRVGEMLNDAKNVRNFKH